MKTLLSVPLLAAAIFSCAQMSWAAEGECRVRAIVSQAGSLPAEVYVHDAAGSATAGKVAVKTFLNHQFDLLAPKKGGAMVLTTKAEPASVKSEEDVVGECELPVKAASLILFVVPESPGKVKSKVTVIDASAKAFPEGSFKVVNLSSVPVRIELEDEKFEFKPAETKIIAKPPVGDAGSAKMKAFCERNGTWEQLSSGIWPSPGDKRVLQVISENAVTKQIEFVGIRDVVKP
ncbi:hypothetical protein OJ996_12595 [Luteolibacter sp. GHJ8]|uniref:Uncharacterized protein n=1 Tax=Luteolibacter rhizosphaerae TaxID=2989719 RepID=A0ABT3G3J4_9BACT|nr:hypothetical protein [Luteolibacter rhizosphaerae]MCW1914419.1 hypothetical protein [Luteolibacter rhizosphaerae]